MTEEEKDPNGLTCPEGFFKGLKYFLIGNIDEKVQKLLSDGGGAEERYMSETITHAIADDCEADDYSEAKELFELTVVTSRWVVLSVKCGALLPTNGFMPEKDQLFSNVVVSCSGLSEADVKRIWGIVTFSGGSCQSRLDSNVTHLVCNKATGPKYEAALSHREIQIVGPDWITECVKTKGRLDEERFHPRLLNPTPPPTPPKPPSPEPVQPPPQPPPLPPQEMLTPKLEPKLEPGTLHATMPLHHISTTTQQQHHQQQQQQLHYGYPPHYASPYAMQTGMQGLQTQAQRPPHMMHPNQQQQQQQQQQMFPQMMMDQAGLKGDSARTKEALARMVSNRLHGRAPGSPEGIRPPMPGSPGGSRPTSPRAHLRNITNNEPKSPRSKMTQLVNSLSRQPPRPMSPGRSALSHQLQQLAANRLAHTAAQQPEAQVFFGHDPIETVPEDLCLLGCVFFITDYQRYLDLQQITTWKKVIEQHGGQVDESYSNRVTHLLCETQHSDVFVMAQRDHKRLVTAYWLNDVLLKKRMTPPWLALHYPSAYGSQKPCANQIISVTNFEGEERQRIKNMVSVIGAKYTGYMCHSNSVLIAKSRDGVKYRKALDWRIPVLNVQWLTDLMLGNLEILKLPPQSKYQQFGSEDDFKVEVWQVGHLLDGWRTPLRIPKDAWKKFNPSELIRRSSLEGHGIKRKASDAEHSAENKKPRMDPPPPLPPLTEGTPIVVITGIPKPKAEILTQSVRRLGGLVSEHPRHCTHLVTNAVSRTVKFLCALSVTKYVVTSYWIEQSAHENKFLDVNNFVLKDTKSEKQFNFNLEQTLRRAQEKPLFKDMKFYISPSVVPAFSVLEQIVESAGGVATKKRSSIRDITQHYYSINGEPTMVFITTEEDLHLHQDLMDKKIPLQNVEFILTGIMQQRKDYKAYEIQPFPKVK